MNDYAMVPVDLELAQQSLIEALRQVLSCRARVTSCPVVTQEALTAAEYAVRRAQVLLERDIAAQGQNAQPSVSVPDVSV